MRRFFLLGLGLATTFLTLFGLVTWLEVPLLIDPSAQLDRGGVLAAALGIGLLVLDVLLPVPSSLVMTAHGALFGWPLGTLLSLLGGVGAVAFAFGLGRRGSRWVARLVGDDRARVDKMLHQYGGLAIIASRPVPLLAETVALLAGTSSMRWRTALVAALLGNLAPALLYALTGAAAASVGESFWVFGGVLAVTGAFWLWARRVATASRG